MSWHTVQVAGQRNKQSPPAPDPEPEVFDPVQVGKLVRAARLAAGLSIGSLARQSGVSQPFVSQLERGQFAPSLTTLYRIAGALKVTPSALLPKRGDESRVARAGRGARLAMSDDGHSPLARMLSQAGSDLLEAFEYEISPSKEPTDWFSHTGEELIYVVSGTLSIELEDQDVVQLQCGDSIHFDAAVPHRWLSTGRGSAKILLVVARESEH